jgi:hypothetical protein
MLPDRDALIAEQPCTILFGPSVDERTRSAGDPPVATPHVTFWLRPCGRARFAQLVTEASSGEGEDARVNWDQIARELMIETVVGIESSATDLRHEFTADDASEVCDVWPTHMYTRLLQAIIDLNQRGTFVPKAPSTPT